MHPLESLIRSYVEFAKPPNASGWLLIRCQVCSDRKIRGGFKFDDHIGYNCFNCNAKMAIKHTSTTISDRAYDVMQAFNIPRKEIDFALLDVAKGKSVEDILNEGRVVRGPMQALEPAEIDLPKDFRSVTDDPSDWAEIANEYLLQRGLTPASTKAMWCTGELNKSYVGRVILPFYKNGKLIYYTGRDMLGVHPKKYLNPVIPRDKIIYGFDRLFMQTKAPLLIFEGVFDAELFDGVAVLSNDLTAAQTAWLQKSPRKKVVIPDRYGDGRVLADHAIKNGWAVAFPEIGAAKDVGDALPEFGKLFIKKSIAETTCTGFQAQTLTNLLCLKKQHNTELTK